MQTASSVSKSGGGDDKINSNIMSVDTLELMVTPLRLQRLDMPRCLHGDLNCSDENEGKSREAKCAMPERPTHNYWVASCQAQAKLQAVASTFG